MAAEKKLTEFQWAETELQYLCTKITDGVHQSVKTKSAGIPFLYVSCVRNGNILWDEASSISEDVYADISKGREPRYGGVLYTVVGSFGHAALVRTNERFSFQRHLAYITPDESQLDSSFLVHWLNSNIGKSIANRVALGNAQKTITLGELSKFPINLPPISIQENVALILDAVDEAIEATRAVIDQTRQLKTALLQDLLTNGLPGRHKKFKRVNYLGQMPLDWSTPPIGDVCEIQLGKMLSKAVRTGRHSKPYLGNSNIKWGGFDLSNLQEMDIREDEMERYSVRKGDILICEGGEVGRTAVWQGAIPVCCYQKAIHRLRAKASETLVPMFMRYFMEFAVRNNLLTRFTGQSSIAHLTRETLVAVPMPLPPHEEQLEIVRALTAIEAAENSNDDSLRCLTALKSALSQGLLTGRIPVRGVA